MSEPQQWRKAHELVSGDTVALTIGEVEFNITMRASGLFWRRRGRDVVDEVRLVTLDQEQAFDEDWHRWVGEGRRLLFRPRVPTRSIVVRPEVPMTLPAKSSRSLLVRMPMWISIELDGAVVADEPVLPPKDTWFGDNTSGELCYAGSTMFRTVGEEAPNAPHRFTTVFHVENAGDRPLLLERIKVPAPYLSLVDGDTGLHSQDVHVVSANEHDESRVTIAPAPTRSISGPRGDARHSLLTRTFENISRIAGAKQ